MEKIKVNTCYQGNCLSVMQQWLPSQIDMCITSPPYYGLRNYGTEPQIFDGHPNCNHTWEYKIKKGHKGGSKSQKLTVKGVENFQSTQDTEYGFCTQCHAWKGELGQEPDPDLYIQHLVSIFKEVRRVCKTTGSLWINIGDSYNGSGGAGSKNSQYRITHTHSSFGKEYEKKDGFSYPINLKGIEKKSLIGIPFRLVLAMIAEGFILRNTIIWHKPNCMPESVEDRFTNNFEYLFFFVFNDQYYFKQQLEPITQSTIDRTKYMWVSDDDKKNKSSQYNTMNGLNRKGRFVVNEQKNKRSVWSISTRGNPEAHFATFNEDLIHTPIDACCPLYICDRCGKSREWKYEIIGIVEYNQPFGGEKYKSIKAQGNTIRKKGKGYWSTCDCRSPFTNGVVLDPFFGSGTTSLEASNQGKNWVGIELNPIYIEISKKFEYLTKSKIKHLSRYS